MKRDGRRSEQFHRSEQVVTTESVWKRYGDVVALAGVSFEANMGEVVGVLGRNGAGKTSFLEILAGLRAADSGRITVLGAENCQPLPREVRARIGVAAQASALPQRLTVEEVLRLYSTFYRRPIPVGELIERVALEDKRRTQIRFLSGGQHQRLVIALAILGRPDLLVLDEPTAGLDPQARRVIWDLLRGRVTATDALGPAPAIILTTHQMDEAASLCARISIFDHGRVLATGSPRELVDRICPEYVVRFRTDSLLPSEVVEAASGLVRVDTTSTDVMLRCGLLEPCLDLVMSARRDFGVTVGHLTVESSTIEDVFLTLTGEEIRD